MINHGRLVMRRDARLYGVENFQKVPRWREVDAAVLECVESLKSEPGLIRLDVQEGPSLVTVTWRIER